MLFAGCCPHRFAIVNPLAALSPNICGVFLLVAWRGVAGRGCGVGEHSRALHALFSLAAQAARFAAVRCALSSVRGARCCSAGAAAFGCVHGGKDKRSFGEACPGAESLLRIIFGTM